MQNSDRDSRNTNVCKSYDGVQSMSGYVNVINSVITAVYQYPVKDAHSNSCLIPNGEKQPLHFLVPNRAIFLNTTTPSWFVVDMISRQFVDLVSLFAEDMNLKIANCHKNCTPQKMDIQGKKGPVGKEDQVATSIVRYGVAYSTHNEVGKEKQCSHPPKQQVDPLEVPL